MAVTKANPKDETVIAATLDPGVPPSGRPLAEYLSDNTKSLPALYITDAMWAEWLKITEQHHIETVATILAAAPLLMNRASTQAQAGAIGGALMTARELVRINREGQA